MCEINAKRTQKFVIEFFTSENTSQEIWSELVLDSLLKLEQSFNWSGKIRVHVHELPGWEVS